MKFDEILIEIMVLEENAIELMRRKNKRFRFPIYINQNLYKTSIDVLELSVRARNCMYRAGFNTVGELVAKINGSEDLKKIRGGGTKVVDEVMEQLFCFQYNQLKKDKKIKYIRRIMELNKAN